MWLLKDNSMRKYIIFTIIYLLGMSSSLAQFSAQNSQYVFNSIAVNPGATGINHALNITLNYRTMWQGMQGAPRTMYANIHTPLKNESVSVGMQWYNDRIGVNNRKSMLLSGAYRIFMSNATLSFGLAVGTELNEVNWQEIKTVELDDRVFSVGNTQYWLPSSSTGLYYESATGFAGISIPRMFSEVYKGGDSYKISMNPKYYSIQAMGGKWITLNKPHQLLLASLLRYHSASKPQAEVTMLYSYQRILDLGVTCRWGDAWVFLTRFQINQQFHIAYSYDYTVGRLALYNKGSHEASLFYTFQYKSNTPNTKLF